MANLLGLEEEEEEEQKKNDLRHDLESLRLEFQKSTTDLNLEIWRKTEEERFEARSEETKRRFEEEDLIWRGTIWSSDLPSKNKERRTIWQSEEEVKLESQKLNFYKSRLKNSIFILKLEF